MIRDDWLLRQIEQLGQFLAKLMGAPDAEQQVEAEIEGLTGMSLDVLTSLAPGMVVRLVGHRFGEFRPERVFAAVKILDAAIERGTPAERQRDALLGALIAEIGKDGLKDLEQALQDSEVVLPPSEGQGEQPE